MTCCVPSNVSCVSNIKSMRYTPARPRAGASAHGTSGAIYRSGLTLKSHSCGWLSSRTFTRWVHWRPLSPGHHHAASVWYIQLRIRPPGPHIRAGHGHSYHHSRDSSTQVRRSYYHQANPSQHLLTGSPHRFSTPGVLPSAVPATRLWAFKPNFG